MNSIRVKEVVGGVIHAYGMGGRSITKDIIPEAVDYLKTQSENTLILEELNGVNIEIGKETTAEEAVQQWEDKFEEQRQESIKKHEEWLKSPEGQEYLRKAAEAKAKHDAFVYHSVDEAMLALTEIEPANLKSSATSMEDAVRMCKAVMTVILKCEDLHFDDQQRTEFQETLKALGCATFDQADAKFKPLGDATIGEIVGKKNDIQFPLSAFTNLIDCSKETFDFGKAKMTDGGEKSSWVGEWLAAQDMEATTTTTTEETIDKK